MAKKKPTDKPEPRKADDVLALVQEIMRDQQFAERNLEYQHRRDFLYGRRQVVIPGLPNLQTEYRHPKLRKDGNRFKNRLLGAEATVNLAAQSDGPQALQRAQRMKNWAARLLKKWRAAGVFDGAAFDMVTLGRGCVHLALNRDVMPLWPTEDYGDNPEAFLQAHMDVIKDFAEGERSDLFVPESVPPETVYWSADRSIKLMAARVPLQPLADTYARDDAEKHAHLASLAGAIALDVGRQMSDNLATVYVVEDADYIYHLIYESTVQDAKTGAYHVDGGDLLGCFRNIFGAPMFVDLDGERTGDPTALYSALPLIDGMYETGPLISIFGTMITSGGVEQVQQKLTLKPVPGDEAAQERQDLDPNDLQVRLLNDGIILPPPGYEIVKSGIELGDDPIKALEMLLRQEAEYGYPDVLKNPQEIHATSGYDRKKAQDPVTDLMTPPLEHIGDLDNILIQACFNAVEALDLPVTVRDLEKSSRQGYGGQQVAARITLDPEDIIDVDSSVTFDADTQYSKIADQEEGMKMLDARLVNRDEFLEDFRGIQDVNRWHLDDVVSTMRDEAKAEAIADARAIFTRIKAVTAQGAIAAANLKPPMNEAAVTALQPAPADPLLGATGPTDTTASMPTGPGTAMPIEPTPPSGAEMAGVG